MVTPEKDVNFSAQKEDAGYCSKTTKIHAVQPRACVIQLRKVSEQRDLLRYGGEDICAAGSLGKKSFLNVSN